MSLKLICRVGHYARHGDQHGRSKTTDLGTDQGVFGRDIGGGVPGSQRGSQPVYRAGAQAVWLRPARATLLSLATPCTGYATVYLFLATPCTGYASIYLLISGCARRGLRYHVFTSSYALHGLHYCLISSGYARHDSKQTRSDPRSRPVARLVGGEGSLDRWPHSGLWR